MLSKYLIAACLLALTFGSANASTFDWTLAGDPNFGIIGHGTLTANQSGGQFLVDSISGIVSNTCVGGPPCAPQYRNIIGLLTPGENYGGFTHIGGDNLIFPVPAPTFVDGNGIVASIDNCAFSAGCFIQIFHGSSDFLFVSNATANAVDFELTAVSTTPLPSTWLMLLSSFVGLGFFAYRGMKKTAGLAVA